MFVFGGIHEITNELNDTRMFDLHRKTWRIVDEENRNALESGSPSQKLLNKKNDSTYKKNSLKNNGTLL